MPRVVDATAQWEFSTRLRGEVLVAEARDPGIYLALLGVPEGFTSDEVEGWLHDVAGVARETAAGDVTLKPIPALLHHALTGMLFSHAELWNSREPGPSSVVFVREGDEVGFGSVGDAEIAVLIDEQPADIQWVTVRDDEGREARAWSIDADRAVRARIMWSAGPDPDAPAVRIEASWNAGAHAEPRAPAALISAAAPAPSAPIAAPAPAPPEPPRIVAPVPTPVEPPQPVQGAAPSVEPEEIGFSEDFLLEPSPALGESARAPEPGLPQWGTSAEPLDEPEEEPVDDPAAAEVRARMGTFGPVAELPPGFPMAIPPVAPPEPPALPPAPRPVAPAPRPAPPVQASAPPAAPPRPAPPPVAPPRPPERRVVSDPRAISLPVQPPPPPPVERVRPLPLPAVEPVDEIAPAEPFEWEEPEPFVEMPEEVAPAPGVEPGVVVVRQGPRADAEVTEEDSEFAVTATRKPRRVPALSPDWPQIGPPVPWWKNRWLWAGAAAMMLVAIGWMVGSLEPRPKGPARARAAPTWMRALGLGGPRFELTVRSSPDGAWISIDGKASEVTTPAIIELTPGEHQLELSLAGLGKASYTVKGKKDEQTVLDATLTGALEIYAPDPGSLIAVSLDGAPQGFAPLTIDSLSPGAHELRFSGPGMASWGQTVEIVVGETKQILTRPLRSPATGLLVVRATTSEYGEPQPLSGAQVWIDGVSRGTTPLQLELARGPHSIRVAHGDQQAPIQVIDLPGGNQRFADFELGLDVEYPHLMVSAPARIPADPPVVISAAIEGVVTSDVREMWLHVRTPEGPWRRYAMEILKTPSGVAGAVVFPPALLDPNGKAPYYISAMTGQGDEYFTEMRTAVGVRSPRPSTP